MIFSTSITSWCKQFIDKISAMIKGLISDFPNFVEKLSCPSSWNQQETMDVLNWMFIAGFILLVLGIIIKGKIEGIILDIRYGNDNEVNNKQQNQQENDNRENI